MTIRRLQTEEKVLGILMGLLSAVFVAAYITTNKYVYANHDISAVEYGLIFSVAGAVFAFGSLAFQLNKTSRKLIHGNSWSLLTLGLAGALAVGTFTIGQRYTTAVNASLLMTSTIVATALFSHVFLRERHSKTQYAWIGLLFVGLYVGIVGLQSIHLHAGDLIILGSALFFGFGNAYSRVVMQRMGGARLVPDVRLAVGGVLALIAAIFIVQSWELVYTIAPLALLAGLFYWLCMKSFAKAVYLINANNTIVLNNSQIFFTSLAGVLILSESYSIEKLAGSVIAIIAIYFIAGKK
jgi:drug/metabolite transporter (DMT)-like permease